MKAAGNEKTSKKGAGVDPKQLRKLAMSASPARLESTASKSTPMSTLASKT